MKKTKERIALDEACRWLEQSGVCAQFEPPFGNAVRMYYESTDLLGLCCDKDFSQNGVCAKCLAQHFLRMAAKEMKK